MIEKETIDRMPEKGKQLSEYLNQKEHTEILLLDLLRSWDLWEKEYQQMLKDSEQAYFQFLKDMKTKPVDEKQMTLDFEDNE